MKKTVWTFGLISGALMAAMMIATLPFIDQIGFDKGEILGYTAIVAGFLLVFFGLRSYRDNVAGGKVGFGRAFTVGLLIATISSVCYTATWEVVYFNFMPDFGSKYAEAVVAKARTDGKTDAELAQLRAKTLQMMESYKNPVYNSALTFLEPFPVGVVIALVSAGVLSRKRSSESVLAPA